MAAPRNRRHIVVPGQPLAETFTPHGRKIEPEQFKRPKNRLKHAASLTTALETAQTEAVQKRSQAIALAAGASSGIYVEFIAPAGVDLALESLDLKGSGIRILSVHPQREGEAAGQRASVFIPDGRLGEFVKRFDRYANEKTKKGEPKHKEFVDRIAAIRLSSLQRFWMDDPDGYPGPQEVIWWEVWLRRSDGSEVQRFAAFCAQAGIELGLRRLAFTDRIVCLARATPEQLSGSLDVLGDMAEVRRAKTSSLVFADEGVAGQQQWVDNLIERLGPPPVGAPAVCVLDTGANRGHKLIEPALAELDATAVDTDWGPHDNGGGFGSAGHGTQMAGLALYGDLVPVLESLGPVQLRHCLESVKVLPPTGANRPDLYGAVTAAAVSRPEIQAAKRNRVFSMAVTAPADDDAGQPTSWSAAIDALAAGRSFDATDGGLVYLNNAEGEAHRLFVISAGNVPPDQHVLAHLDRSDTSLVQDPAQSWNAVTVGACTDKALISDSDYEAWFPVAQPGDLSPWSTTSCGFDAVWPNKPDVVFEGGNVAHDGNNSFDPGVPDLCLLSMYYQPTAKPFVLTHATSAATAQVARMAAILAAEYPALWPETRRALIIHSARWTKRMQAAVDGASGKKAKGQLVRRYGFGVPSLSGMLRSANDALTLIVESAIHPYKDGKMREMHVHELPWPQAVLKELDGQVVRLRVTLSYFIEPSPARLGWKRRHSYASHALRFDVRLPTESTIEFRKRLNKKALEAEEKKPTGGSDSSDWVLGDVTRHRGSLHCDMWEGTAADLAERSVIGIYPVSGWWKDQRSRDRSDGGARYALVVSIESDAEGIDIWTPVAQQIGVPIVIEGGE